MFREGSRVRQTPEEGRRTYRPKHYGNNFKDNDKKPLSSSALLKCNTTYTKPFCSRLPGVQSSYRKISKSETGKISNPPKGGSGFHTPN